MSWWECAYSADFRSDENDCIGILNSRPIIKVTAAILEWEGHILIAQRGSGDPLAGKWEFPGGKIEPGETPEDCLKREIREELNIEVEILEPLGSIRHHYSEVAVELIGFRAAWISGEIRPSGHADFRWVARADLGLFDFAAADRPFVEWLVRP